MGIGMGRARHILVSVVALIFSLTACSHQNPQRQHDEILFERATTAVQQKRFDVANITLRTLVATYPDSEYVDRAKEMLQDPRLARCGGEGFSNTPASLCDPDAPSQSPASGFQVQFPVNSEECSMGAPKKRSHPRHNTIVPEHPCSGEAIEHAEFSMGEVRVAICSACGTEFQYVPDAGWIFPECETRSSTPPRDLPLSKLTAGKITIKRRKNSNKEKDSLRIES
jgi:hypothetical protein